MTRTTSMGDDGLSMTTKMTRGATSPAVRALLQSLGARILDEKSFAALDPETMTKVLACVLRDADTLVVIAHP